LIPADTDRGGVIVRPEDIKALTFDVGGSVFDWQTPIRAAIIDLNSDRGTDINEAEFALDWRAEFFKVLGAVRDGSRPWMSADAILRAALDELDGRYRTLALSGGDKESLTRVWHHMHAWPEVPEAVARLRTRYPVVVLTILSVSIVIDCSRRSGLAWDAILSGELIGHYKPDPECYLAAARLLQLEPREVLMVAAHPGDLQAARNVGMGTARMAPNLEEPDMGGIDIDPKQTDDFFAENYNDLADQLCG
jgi:2-haloacid dehalogenase